MYDAIIVLGGGELSEGRVNEAIRLYNQGIAKYLIIVGGSDDYEKMYKKALKEIKNIENIYFDGNSSSTIDNAFYAKRIIKKLNVKSILILTSKFHVKRAIKSFELFLGNEYKIDAIGVEDNPDTYTLFKERYLDKILYLYDYLKGRDDEEIKAFFDTIKGPLNKILNRAYELGLMEDSKTSK
ncbi:YdcF family protein [Saccharolobus shibatae]|uniref:DUF218 domain-containing protein n=1 Tax=Saccharolobus shibatae TaxID=2286 RepID=A0A8F5BWA4_9CREN|nr:YdcF family protein [Saccharolobus shibatae]QXJ32629.1 hypothetical protein J5U21_02280 [Saccharolobus shibatae]